MVNEKQQKKDLDILQDIRVYDLVQGLIVDVSWLCCPDNVRSLLLVMVVMMVMVLIMDKVRLVVAELVVVVDKVRWGRIAHHPLAGALLAGVVGAHGQHHHHGVDQRLLAPHHTWVVRHGVINVIVDLLLLLGTGKLELAWHLGRELDGSVAATSHHLRHHGVHHHWIHHRVHHPHAHCHLFLTDLAVRHQTVRSPHGRPLNNGGQCGVRSYHYPLT